MKKFLSYLATVLVVIVVIVVVMDHIHSFLARNIQCEAYYFPHTYQNQFEEKIVELISLATNDYTLGVGGPFQINMALREKYFTPEAWIQYKDYVKVHKKYLGNFESSSVYASPNFDEIGCKFSVLDGKTFIFKATGRFYYMQEGDLAMGYKNSFDLNVSYKKKSSPQDFSITKWQIEMHEIRLR